MAINPDVAFPGKTAGVSPAYPYGKARDVSAPGDGTGTPLRAAWVNDWFGLQQQLLSLAGIVPSGVADAVGACQVWDALRELLIPRSEILAHPLTERGAGLALADFPSLWDFQGDLTQALAEAKTGGYAVAVVDDITVSIPTHASKLQDAVPYLVPQRGVRITVQIEAGHVLTGPLLLSGGDYSQFTITSDDPAVSVANDALAPFGQRPGVNPVFGADNGCVFPTVDVLLDMSTYTGGGQRNGSGVVALGGSAISITPGKGAKGAFLCVAAYDGSTINAPGVDASYAVEAGLTSWSNSNVYADGANASHSEKYGIRSTEGASLVAKGADASYCGRHAARAVAAAFLDVSDSNLSHSATNAVYARHSSIVNANNCNLSSSGSLPLEPGEVNAAVYALRASIVSAIACNCDDSVAGFLADSGSVIAGSTSTLRNCTDAILVKRGSTVDASFCDAAGSTNVALVEDASSGVLTGVTCANPTQGIRVTGASKADCRSAVITGCANPSLYAFDGSSANADSATFTGSAVNSVYAIGSYISARLANCSNSNRGFVADHGATVDAASAIANNCASEGAYALSGGNVNFTSSSATGCGRAIRADAGVVSAKGATLTGATIVGVLAANGSDVNVTGANCRRGGADDPTDIQCFSGSIVKAYTAIGGVSTTKNTPTANGLILG